MRTKLLSSLDIVLSARLVHADVERTKEQAHKICDPHLAIALVSARPTVQNPVDIAAELAMLDAAATLSKECLEEVEKLHRSVAKTIMQIEVLDALGAKAIPLDETGKLEEQFLECGLRLEEMSKIRELSDVRCKALVSQL